MPSYQCWDSHYKDKTVSRPSYLYNDDPHTRKNRLRIEMGPRFPSFKGILVASTHWYVRSGGRLYRLLLTVSSFCQEGTYSMESDMANTPLIDALTCILSFQELKFLVCSSTSKHEKNTWGVNSFRPMTDNQMSYFVDMDTMTGP